ncbi:uncharacterized protein LOC127806686 [Diospyros lotus]|uniref:uncharacterized protein LOC127806686 n=1 Tax=Diospyros lotus TaxID=55363 RepID=UPI002250AAB4|nr:uncharacterized protein LOC127806686 [Diospyros lotus]
MDRYESHGLLGILIEFGQLLNKSMLIVTAIDILLSSLLFFTKFFSNKRALYHFESLKTLLITIPNNLIILLSFNDVQGDVRKVLGSGWVFLPAILAYDLFSIAAMVLVGRGKRLSSTNFLSRLARSLVRPFVKLYCFNLSNFRFIFLSLVFLIFLVIILFDHTISIFWLGVATLILGLYLSVVWTLPMVISVIEEGYETEAIGKAKKLAEGKKLHGFALSCLFAMMGVGWILMHEIQKQQSNQIVVWFLTRDFTCLALMFQFLSYTVFYLERKKAHGEEMGLLDSTEYSKILSTELA